MAAVPVQVLIAGVVFTNNTAAAGGGLCLKDNLNHTAVTNCTVVGNTAAAPSPSAIHDVVYTHEDYCDRPGQGGGLCITAVSPVVISNSSIHQNSARYGGEEQSWALLLGSVCSHFILAGACCNEMSIPNNQAGCDL